jgi:hypothetical protein
MMIKSEAHFVVSNFNHDPMPIIEYAKNYLIMDQSTDRLTVDYLSRLNNPSIRFSKHVGHNLIDYLDYIIENYEKLPPLIAFLKGNTIGRHISQEDWNQIYLNQHYTFVFTNNEERNVPNVHFAGSNSDFNEINNSWFVWHSHHRYFSNTNQLIEFLYENPKYPEYLTFSPGACYFVESTRITNKPVSLYIGLKEILSYEFFPSEAWIVERLLHTIFFSNQKFKSYVYDTEKFLSEISKIPDRSQDEQPRKSLIEVFQSRLYWKAKRIIKSFQRSKLKI